MERDAVEARVVAVCASLQGYAWRRFTAEHLVRRVLAAADRHALADLLASVPYAEVGAWEPPRPVPSDDPRIAVLVGRLVDQAWTGRRLDALCRHVLDALDDAS